MKKTAILLFSHLFSCIAAAQVSYTGNVLSDPQRHDGGLAPVIGVHCIQTMRADRENPDSANNVMPWTYNHQPMLVRWGGKLWMHYLSDPVSEHVPPSQTYVQSSADGYVWSAPQTLFPDYGMGMMAVMHQRVGWYVSSKATGSRLLALGHYGICRTPGDDPNDGNGIGRVVREVKADGSFGPIYFLYYNHDHQDKPIRWPLYTASKDKHFRKACEELLADPLMWMQMVEECDRNDPRLPMTNIYKAFCHYTLPDDSTIVGLWKHALTSQSKDGGRTWSKPVARARGFVNGNAKIWGQRVADGSYVTVYNPSEYRWPLAVSTSNDGEKYTTLNLIHGEVTPLRYGGQYKNRGPQYARGIAATNAEVGPSDRFYVAYSMNKEDMWVARVPVPVRTKALCHADDDFAIEGTFDRWNIISPLYAPVKVADGRLMLADRDRHDFAKAERVIPATRCLEVEMNVTPMQSDHGELQIELLDDRGDACTRLTFCPDGSLTVKTGARYNNVLKTYAAGKEYSLRLLCDLDSRMITVWVDGKKTGPKILMAPLSSVTRLSLRTGGRRTEPTIDTPADTPAGHDLPDAGITDPLAVFYINNVRTRNVGGTQEGALLCWADFEHYVRYFNAMEPEGIVQAVPDSCAARWMEDNIPLFECPDKQIEEMFYFRWWSLRKSIRHTPQGYVMNEFLIDRSYADKYNLIACALGHHIMESRWLRNDVYLEDNVRVWLRGGEHGKPLPRLDTFSSWLPWAMWQRSLQQGSTLWMADYNRDLQEDVARWETSNLCADSLFWQRDVKDGMEEQISGARKQNHRRPTINSYMYGNYMALSWLNGNTPSGQLYAQKAAALKERVTDRLWNRRLKFFGTLTTADTLAAVREEIGYLPWYFSMPDDDAEKYLPAWMQLADERGFNAPFGITTAERRHPQFRKRFRPQHPTCEWDGAVWPFATSQTLTALANVMNSCPRLAGALTDSCRNIVFNRGASPKDARECGMEDANLFFYHLKKYTESQYRRGRPYIGEYLDETDGQWLMGDRERSRYYNHSTYNDLIITGLVGLRPSMGDSIEVHPLVPSSWDYFCIDNLPYHGQLLTIFYDKNGDRYHQGKGLHIVRRRITKDL
ncbi:MAG: MGH1-like glycoside hydrolase domain-containing protein [Prevotella sp.]